MPNLSCGVDKCTYNQNDMCSLNTIKVNGSFAKQSKTTCCGSFVEKGGFTNAAVDVGEAEPATSVDCEAEKCCHNKNLKCHAESIDISGDYAQNQESTNCATFKPE